jgi:serine protease Do
MPTLHDFANCKNSILQHRRNVTILTALIAFTLTAGCSGNFQNEEQQSAPRANLSTAPLSYANVVQNVAPAVVTVRAEKRVHVQSQSPVGGGFLRQFFGGGLFGPSAPSEEERSLGSGVIVRADGHILTNDHVIDGSQNIKVDLSNHQTYSAKVIGKDAPSDLAVLKIDAGNLPVLQLGDSDKVRVGDICLAIGNPLGVGQTVTSGIISAKGRTTGLSNGSFEDFLQTDAPINQGNSGGALVNTTGALIGINSQIISTTGGSIGLGFAIPSNMAKVVMDQLIKTGKVTRGHLGTTVQMLTSDLAQSLGISNTQGAVVSAVEPGSPAEKAGIKPGDIVTAMNGNKIQDPNTLRNDVANTAPGTTVTLTIVRDGKQMDLRPTLAEAPANAQPQQQSQGGPAGVTGQLGIAVEPLTPDLASQLGMKPGSSGVVITNIDPSGPAANAGLQAGDVILQINRQPIHSASDIAPALAKAGGRPSLLLVNHGGQNFFVPLNAG